MFCLVAIAYTYPKVSVTPSKQVPRKKKRVLGVSNSKYVSNQLKVQMKCFFFIPEFERAAKIRKIAVYRFLISFLVPEL